MLGRAATACCIAVLAPAGGTVAAPPDAPPMPAVTARGPCPTHSPGSDEIVVCGRGEDDGRYRIPPELRDRGAHADRNASWAARTRDEGSLERFGSQSVGPGGWTEGSRQIDCEWRAARQEAQGQRPDCTRRVGWPELPGR